MLGGGGRVGICVVFQEKRYLGCQGQAVLRETGEQSAPPGGCWGALINPAPGLDFCPSAHSPEGILAEWILRPGQFQGNHGALGPDRGHGTSKVTLRMGQAAHTWPPQVLGLPGTKPGILSS